MTKILSRADKKKRDKENRRLFLVQRVKKFCKVDEKEKRISISHPQFNDLTKVSRDYIADLKIEYGYYIQWEIFDIPPNDESKLFVEK